MLEEAWRFDGTIPGYERVAAPRDEFPHPEARSTILLVRKRGVRLPRVDFLQPDGPKWVGPKHGKVHPPRVFPDVDVETEGQLWPLLGIHRTPGGPDQRVRVNRESWAAEDRAIEDWFDRHAGRGVASAVGDCNGRKSDPARLGMPDLARRVGGDLVLRGIDGGIVVGAARARAVELDGLYGSDTHKPVRLTITAPKENR